MNDSKINDQVVLPSGEIGYTLLDDTGHETNTMVRELLIVRATTGPRSDGCETEQATAVHNHHSEYVIVLLLVCLLGFLLWFRWRRKR